MAQKIASLHAEIGANTKPLEDGLKKTKQALGDTEKEAKKLSERIGNFAKGFGKFALETGATALGAAFVYATKQAIELEAEFGHIAALTDTPKNAIAGLRKEVMSLSADLPISAKELAGGLYFISSSGFQGAQAMDILKTSATAAAAGLGETKVIADAVTSALNAYQLEGKDAARITDLLTFAVKEGKGEPDELAGSLGRVLPVAAAAKVGMEDVAAAMAIMTRTGMSADEAATSLRGTIGALLAPAKQSKDALGALGLTTEDVANMLAQPGGLVNVLKVLMERTGGNVEQLDAIIPNIRALTGVLSLAGSQADDYAAALNNAYNALGLTDKAAAEMAGTMEFKLAKAKNSVENLGIAITEKLLPGLGDAAEAATTLITWQDKMQGAFENTTEEIASSAKTYEEYYDAAVKVAKASGKLSEEQAQALLTGKTWIETEAGMIEVSYDLAYSLGVLTKAQFEARKATENEGGAVDGAVRAMNIWKESLTDATAANEEAGWTAIKTADQLKEEEKALKKYNEAMAQGAIDQSNFVESFKEFDKVKGFEQTISDLEERMKADPENREKYAAHLRLIKTEAGLITPAMEAAAGAFQTLEELWLSGDVSTESYVEAMGKIKQAAADNKVEVDELGLKTSEAAAFMTASAGEAKTAQEGIVNDARATKERLMDEMGNALAGQQTKLQSRISDSMLSVSNSFMAAGSLANTTSDIILKAWDKVPKTVMTEYIVKTTGSVPSGAPSGGLATGGIIAGANGFITQKPTYLLGEGGYSTFAGRGAEAVIPLNQRGISILAEALRQALGSGGDINTTINAGGVTDVNALADVVQQRLARQFRGRVNSGSGYRR